MSAIRTQIYLTKEQRARLDARGRREDKTLAQLVRDALDRYLEDEPSAPSEALDRTFGACPDIEVPPRSEWDRERG